MDECVWMDGSGSRIGWVAKETKKVRRGCKLAERRTMEKCRKTKTTRSKESSISATTRMPGRRWWQRWLQPAQPRPLLLNPLQQKPSSDGSQL